MKAKDIVLIALVCANVTLAAMAVTAYLGKMESKAYATSEMRAGDYVVLCGPVTSSREALMVIDVVSQRANLYMSEGATGGGRKWEMVASRNLVADFGVGP